MKANHSNIIRHVMSVWQQWKTEVSESGKKEEDRKREDSVLTTKEGIKPATMIMTKTPQ